MSAPLLAVDGDSFAHRAYHALPKSINRNAVVGFTNMITRLWEQEQPRAVLAAWDTLEVPTYRHEAFAAYQSGREFDASLLEQLAMLPQLCTALSFPVAKAPGYEADDFLAAAVAYEEARGGTVLVASGDRDAFQLVSDRTTVLHPVRGVSEIARIGPQARNKAMPSSPTRYASGTASNRGRCPTSSPFGATRRTSSPARRASAPRPPRRC